MKTIFKLFLIILILHAELSFSQELSGVKKRFNGITVGLSLKEMREESMNRAIHRGTGLSLGFFSESLNGRSLRRVEFLVSSHFLKSRFEEEISSFSFNGSLRFRQLFNVCNPEDCQSIFVGGSASLDAGIAYFDNWDENHFYWRTSYSLGLDSRIQKRLGRDKIQIEAGIPLLSVISRPPNPFPYSQSSSNFLKVLKNLHENPRVSLPHQDFTGNILLRYCFEGDSKVRKSLFWQTNYLHNRIPGSGTLNSLTHRLGVEFIL